MSNHWNSLNLVFQALLLVRQDVYRTLRVWMVLCVKLEIFAVSIHYVRFVICMCLVSFCKMYCFSFLYGKFGLENDSMSPSLTKQLISVSFLLSFCKIPLLL